MAERQLLIRILGDSKGAQAAVDGLSGITEKLSGHMGALGAAIGGALTVGAVTGFATSAVGAFESVAGATKNLQRLTGDTAEDASRLRTAFQLTGIDADAGANAIKKFSKAVEGGNAADDKAAAAIEAKNAKLSQNLFLLEQVKNPTAQQTEQMAVLRKEIDVNTESLGELNVNVEKYGIQTKNLDGSQKGTNQLLEETADIFKKMPDGMEKNALAMKLFGKSGTDMLPFLNKGAEGVKALEKESDKLGLTLSQKNIDAMAKSKAASREWHAALQGLQVQIGAQLMPILTTMSVWLAERIPPAMEVLRAKFAEAQPYIERFGRFLQSDVAPALDRFGRFLQSDVVPAVMRFAATMRADLTPIVERVAQIIRDDLIPAATTVFEYLSNHHGVLVAIGVAFAALINPIGTMVGGLIYAYEHFQTFHDIVDGTIHAVQTIIETVMGAIEAFWRTWGGNIERVAHGLFNGLRDFIQGLMDIIRGVITTVMALIHGDWSGAWDGIKEIVKGVWEAMHGIVESAAALIQGAIEAGMRLIAGVFSTAWSGIKSAASEALDLLVDFFTKLPGRIVKGLGDLTKLLVSLGLDIITGLGKGIHDAWDGLVMWVESIPRLLKSALGDLADLLFDIGKAIISGLWDGMKAIWKDVTGWLGGLGGAIKNLKGPISKDSVLLTDEGRAIITGLHDGMKDAWQPIPPFLTAIGTQMVDATTVAGDNVLTATDAFLGNMVDSYTTAGGAIDSALGAIVTVAAGAAAQLKAFVVGSAADLAQVKANVTDASWGPDGYKPPTSGHLGPSGLPGTPTPAPGMGLVSSGGSTNLTVIQHFNGQAPTGDTATHLQAQAAAQFGRELTVALRGAA